MRLSEHATDRMDERVGLSTDAANRLALKALERGIKHADTAGSLHRFLDGLFLRHRNANNMRIYGEHVYLFNANTLVTVLHLPHKYKAAVAKLRKRGSDGDV